jgi:hypothetical protein
MAGQIINNPLQYIPGINIAPGIVDAIRNFQANRIVASGVPMNATTPVNPAPNPMAIAAMNTGGSPIGGLQPDKRIRSRAQEYARVLGKQEDAEEMQARGTTLGYDALNIAANIAPFAADMLMTRGAMTGTKKAVEGAMKSAPKTGKVLGAVAGTTAKTAAMPHRVFNEMLDRMSPTVKLTPGEKHQFKAIIEDEEDSAAEAFLRAFGNQWVEVSSEHLGDVFTKIPVPAKVKAKKAAVVNRWLKANPDSTIRDAMKRLGEATAWHGLVPEVLEERAGEVMRPIVQSGVSAITGTSSPGEESYQQPTWRQLLAEGIAFSIPGLGSKTISAADDLRLRRDLTKTYGIPFSETKQVLAELREIRRVQDEAELPIKFTFPHAEQVEGLKLLNEAVQNEGLEVDIPAAFPEKTDADQAQALLKKWHKQAMDAFYTKYPEADPRSNPRENNREARRQSLQGNGGRPGTEGGGPGSVLGTGRAGRSTARRIRGGSCSS